LDGVLKRTPTFAWSVSARLENGKPAAVSELKTGERANRESRLTTASSGKKAQAPKAAGIA
jgi:hypothetical protein